MLVLSRLEVEGFGPFASRQVIDFPERGVTVVYGDNMRGKTSLLNAARFALFERIVGRGSTERRASTVSNRELAAEGKYGFTVSLRFTADDVDYELTRVCRLRAGVEKPEGDSDFQFDVVLRRGTDEVLGPQDRENVLAQILPEQVARFFLFDGELLQEYEELLYEGRSDTGRKISVAIERILGVPLLKRARAHAQHLREASDREAARKANQSKETQALGASIEQADAQLEAHRQVRAEAIEELKTLQEKRAEAEGFLGLNERARALMGERDAAQERLEAATAEQEAREADLRREMSRAWRTVLAQPVRRVRAVVQDSAERGLEDLAVGLRRQAVSDQHCVVCESELDEAKVGELQAKLAQGDGAGDTASLADNLRRAAVLSGFEDADVGPSVAQLESRVRDLRIECTHLRGQIRDHQTALEDVDEERMGATETSLSDVMKKIAAMEHAISQEGERIDELEKDIAQSMSRLEKRGTLDLGQVNRRAAAYREIERILVGAVERYKQELRQQVQDTATELFLLMTTEKAEFAGLRINESYGLEIVHTDGLVEEGRSAGAEHVVALALIGALQKHAPLRGPILMDSTFGRLDPRHAANVVEALTSMAQQVVLLVQENELSRDRVRGLLEGDLAGEYELVYRSARRTDILPAG